MPTLKYSRQREAIKSFLITRKDHPTADVVYTNVREQFPNISLGTVYRNLTLLADLGEITRLHVGDGVDHFDGDTSPHYHFVCTCCGSVIDFDAPALKALDALEGTDMDGHRIDRYIAYFYGTCRDCCSTSRH